MARLGDNPIKSPLDGNELIPFTDPGTNDDGCTTPDGLQAYLLANLPLATDTGNGLMSAADHIRLYSLYTAPRIDAFNAIFKEEAIGFYVGTVANGALAFMANALDALTIETAYVACASGTVTLAVQIDGVSITGMGAIAVTSTKQLLTATALKSLATAAVLSLLFSANSTCLGFYITIKAYKVLP